MLTAEGVPLEGPEPPAEIVAFARRVASAGEGRSERTGTLHLVGRPVTTPGGQMAIVVAVVRRPPRACSICSTRVRWPGGSGC